MSTAAKNLIIVPIGVIDDPEWNDDDAKRDLSTIWTIL